MSGVFGVQALQPYQKSTFLCFFTFFKDVRFALSRAKLRLRVKTVPAVKTLKLSQKIATFGYPEILG